MPRSVAAKPGEAAAGPLYPGAAGSGGVLFEITDSVEEINGEITLEGTWPLTAEDVVNLRINYVYVNLHTEANPSGEIRGNVTPID